jgi:hypothetical protein
MKWNKDTYTISTDVAKELVEFLHNNWFCTTSDGDSNNNPEVIELSKRFEAVLEAQELKTELILEQQRIRDAEYWQKPPCNACGQVKAHPCPFLSEVYSDCETRCQCCAVCTEGCHDHI